LRARSVTRVRSRAAASGDEEGMQAVPYDQGLADRLRELLSGEPGLAEKKMFGGLAFLIGGNMAIAASGQGGLMVRVDPAQSDTLTSTTPARIIEMRGRPMRGWLYLE